MGNLIATTEICTYHEVEYAFISSLNEAGLLQFEIVDQTTYVIEDDLQKLEKMIRMHHELEINIAGIEAIMHLLQRVEQMQDELRTLRNRHRN